MKLKIFHIRQTKEHLKSDEDNASNFLENVNVKNISTQFISGQPNYWSILVFYKEKEKETVVLSENSKTFSKIKFPANTELIGNEIEKLKVLREWRFDKAKELNLPAFMICHNTELISIVKSGIESTEQLYTIKGFGDEKVSKYGNEIIAALNSI